MSKQSEAKAAQNYRREFNCCENCAHFRKDVEMYPDYWDKSKTWTRDKNIRCGIGGFKVHKTALCDRHELRATPSNGGGDE